MRPVRAGTPERLIRTGAIQGRWLRLLPDEWAGFNAEGRAAAVRGRDLRARRRAVRCANHCPPQPPDAPSSILRRRSIRCLTSASPGPTSMQRRDRSAAVGARARPVRRPRLTRRTGEVRYAVVVEGLSVARQCRRAADRVPQAIGARGRPQGSGQRRPDRPPLARRCRAVDRIAPQPGLLRCGGRAAHRARRRHAAGRARRRSRPAIPLCLGRLAGPRGGRAGSREAAQRVWRQSRRSGDRCRT